MPFAVPKDNYNGKISDVSFGKDGAGLAIGGASSFPFLTFEGEMPNQVAIAYEVLDAAPEDWAESLAKVYGQVFSNAAGWAAFCQDELHADAICLRLLSIHPEQGDRSPDEAAQTVKEVLDAIRVPLIIVGANHIEKDAEVIKVCAEAASGHNCLIGKAQEKNYKTIAAAAMAYNHYLIALSNLDINLAKQLNILLTQMGVPANRIVMDPMASGLGYGLEYCYSVMERIRNAALKQNDTMVQMPMVADIGLEAWKAKEAKAPESDQPAWGDAEYRGQMWEQTTALAFALAGADMMIMRHPKAVETVRKALNELKEN
jgi:acetyl-CoA decarbonylase/synthase complex subunit delta